MYSQKQSQRPGVAPQTRVGEARLRQKSKAMQQVFVLSYSRGQKKDVIGRYDNNFILKRIIPCFPKNIIFLFVAPVEA